MRGLDTSHCCTSCRIISACFLLISLKAFPTDFRRYSLSCPLCLAIRAIATVGFSLKYGRLVQILNPSVTARITLGLVLFIHSLMRGKDASYPLCLQISSKAFASISYTRQFSSMLTCSFKKQSASSFVVANLPNIVVTNNLA